MPLEFHLGALLNGVIYAVLGVVVLIVVLTVTNSVLEKLTPYDLRTEIIEKQNAAVAVLAGLAAMGVAIIIAAALH
jgi:putative membrane protein